ncbi:MAG TPA: hypothetical protein VF547_00260 [Allosphingosinicella sp.]
MLKRLSNALPAVLAAAPSVIGAVKQVKQALKKPTKLAASADAEAEAAADSGAPPRRLSADSEQTAR